MSLFLISILSLQLAIFTSKGEQDKYCDSNLLEQKISTHHLEVRGTLIDIMPMLEGNTVFPQNNTFKFGELDNSLTGKSIATSLMDNEGVLSVRCAEKTSIYIAYANNELTDPKWIYTDIAFNISSARTYYIYRAEYSTTNEWVDIPLKPNSKSAPTLVIHNNMKVDTTPLHGATIITKTQALKQVNLTNPTITILPDGDYLAAISGAFIPSKSGRRTSFLLSSDKGKTWKVQSKNSLKINYGNLFVYNNELYIMGARTKSGDVIIAKSSDKGKTWTQAMDEDSGLILKGKYHTAPVPVVVAQGRIWRAMETNEGRGISKKAFMLSAPENSNLLKASSWTASEKMESDKSWIEGRGRSFKQWIEGNAVEDKEGNIVNILRVDEEKEGGKAAIITLKSIKELSFDPTKDIIDFPGGGKKFSIRYDSISNKYWTLSNAEFAEDRKAQHSGLYKKGIHCGLLRNRLVLMSSVDLRQWKIERILIATDNPFFHGFQYADWQFEEEDIIAVLRTAYNEERGLPTRQHDANLFTFHRFKNFRK